LQYRLDGEKGCPRAEWCALTHDWNWNEGSPATWSEPIFACDGKAVVKGGAPHTDARKSAVTDGLTKATSILGAGYTVFKDLIRIVNGQRSERNGNGYHPTLAQNHAIPSTITPDNVHGKRLQSTTVHTHPKNDSS
jgi:hypothetical protein